jgi:hypothetical protein
MNVPTLADNFADVFKVRVDKALVEIHLAQFLTHNFSPLRQFHPPCLLKYASAYTGRYEQRAA